MKEKILDFIKKTVPVILVIGVIAFIYTRIGCPARYFFGICCPGCGMTRAAFSILQLDFAAALRYNPSIFVLPVAFIVFLFRKKIPKNVQNILLGVGMSIFCGVYLYRLLTGSEYVYIDFDRGLVFQILKDIMEKIK